VGETLSAESYAKGSKAYPNSGEPELRDIKGQLWRCDAACWIDTGLKERAFRLNGPDGKLVAQLMTDGRLHTSEGYVFDGSSVPLLGRWLDDRTSAWPGCVHDELYEGLRNGSLAPVDRVFCDRLYRDLLRAFGGWWITSRLCYVGLRLFGGSSAKRHRGPEYPRRVA
jgi:hypothetical protein